MVELILRNTGPSLGWALAAVMGLMIVRGFVTGTIYSRQAVLDAQRREADWKAVAERSEAARETLARTVDLQAHQIAELSEASRANLNLLQALRDLVAGRPTS